jgi:hypothetical protein
MAPDSATIRFSKVLPQIISREGKTHLNFDLYNLFNSNTTEVYQRSARYFKLGTQIDFQLKTGTLLLKQR